MPGTNLHTLGSTSSSQGSNLASLVLQVKKHLYSSQKETPQRYAPFHVLHQENEHIPHNKETDVHKHGAILLITSKTGFQLYETLLDCSL